MSPVPDILKRIQAGFAESIMRPLQIDDDGYSYDTDNYNPVLVSSMQPNQIMAGLERLSVYNQQYWFRLLSVLQGECPLSCRRLGLTDFNRLMQDYLTAYPSAAKELHVLPHRLPMFLHENGADAHTVNAATCDVMYSRLFFAEKNRPLNGAALSDEQLQALLTRPLPFQEAWFVFEDLGSCVQQRHVAQLDPDGDDLLEAEGSVTYWALYRHPESGVTEEALSRVQFQLLKRLSTGETLQQALEGLLGEAPEAQAVLQNGLQDWFRRWGELGWFAAVT